jgi:hypothetical protein
VLRDHRDLWPPPLLAAANAFNTGAGKADRDAVLRNRVVTAGDPARRRSACDDAFDRKITALEYADQGTHGCGAR